MAGRQSTGLAARVPGTGRPAARSNQATGNRAADIGAKSLQVAAPSPAHAAVTGVHNIVHVPGNELDRTAKASSFCFSHFSS